MDFQVEFAPYEPDQYFFQVAQCFIQPNNGALSKNKRLNTDVWYDKDTLIWIKASFNKQGKWEYRLRNMLISEK